MTYIRVIPRDLFNESNLLKCLGNLYISLETPAPHSARFEVEDVDNFDIQQNEDDGSIFVANIPFVIGEKHYHLYRPLNSRQSWPLLLSDPDDCDFEAIKVFDEDGKLSAEMLRLISIA